MLPAHWKTLQPLLDEALDATPAERAALLQHLRTDQPALAAGLEDLLHSHTQAQADGFLQGDADGPGLFGSALAGQRLGAYTLEQPIGEGGMGSVWLARRADGRFEGQVAVKLLSLSLASAGRAERFRREGHILGRLTHPHIARLLDAGVSPSGQPYLVLEHVQGQHIDAHCDAARLGLADRIRLVLTLLDAVQHAHSQLVVHRDIKPSNVMVDAAGQLKLLDFGIAKLLTADGQTEAPLTQQAGAMLTPGYAAPEQLQSGAVSTATDVFALGVLLYVLLSGQHPHVRPGQSAAQALQATLQGEVPAMSAIARGDEGRAAARGLRAAAFSRALAGDLDNIVAKAMQHDPARRYATAAAMADDLRRHLARQPVLARPPSLAYLARRFVQRQRVPLAALATALLVAGGLGWQTWQERETARLSQARAQTVDGLLQSLFRGMGPDAADSRNFSARELLGRAQAFLDSRSDIDTATRRATRLRMAALYRDIGAYKEAVAGFQAEAADAQRAGQPAAHALALWQWANALLKQLDTAATQRVLTDLQAVVATLPAPDRSLLGRVALLEGELALVQRHGEQARQALDRADAQLRDGPELELAARAAHSQGVTARLLGDLDAARSHLRRAAALQAQRGSDAAIDRLTVTLDLGGLENFAGQHAAAVAVLAPVQADMLARLGQHHPLTVSAVAELAQAELRQGHAQELRRWLAHLRGTTGAADAWRESHADTLAAAALVSTGQAAQALPLLQQVLATVLREEGGISPASEPVRRLQAEALLRLGRLREAQALLRQTEANQRQLGQGGRASVAITQVLQGVALARAGDLAAAQQAWQAAAAVLAQQVGARHPQAMVAACYAALAGGAAPARAALADQLDAALGWQDGAKALVALLRAPLPPADWRQLPVVL